MNFYEENAQFSGLIRHYARKLGEVHSEGDLWGFLYLVKNKTKNAFPDRYYAVCLRNEYLRLSKEKNNFSPFFDRGKAIENFVEDTKLSVKFALEKLLPKEAQIIRLHYIGGYSIDEIGKLKNVSRQSVNQAKNRALRKLAKYCEL